MFHIFPTLLEKLTDLRHAGHYVAVKVSKDTTAALKKWCKTQDVEVAPDFFDNLHITICYSSKNFPIDVKKDIQPDASHWKVIPIGFEVFGKHHDKQFLVLKVKCQKCSERWKHFMDKGASYDFDEYVPHITIAQNHDGKIGDLDLKSLPKIKLDGEYYETLH